MKHKSKSLAIGIITVIALSCFASLFSVGLTTATGNLYTVRFVQTGLPTGTQWTASYNGGTFYSTGTTIEVTGLGYFTNRAYTINSIAGYTQSPTSGLVSCPDSTPAVISVTYTPITYALDLEASQGGTTSPAPGTHYYTYHGDLNLLAVSDTGYYFTGWSINGIYFAGLQNPIVGQMDDNYQIKALFAENPYTLTVITNGQGTVTPGNSTYNGQTVDLKATPAEGWSFAGWGGDATGTTDTTITMNSSKTVTATFTQNSYALTVVTVGQGTVNQGNQTVLSGATLDLAATPADGWNFSGWSGDATGTADTTIAMNSDKTVIATFTQGSYALTVVTVGQGIINQGNQTVLSGDTLDLTATPADGWSFTGWSGDATGTTDTTTITMSSDKTVIATFKEDAEPTYTLTVYTIGQGTVNPGNKTYAYGELASLTAVAADGWTFSGWSGDTTSTADVNLIIMDSDKTVIATFTKLGTTYTKFPMQIISGNISQAQFSEMTVYTDGAITTVSFSVSGTSGTSGTCTFAVPKTVVPKSTFGLFFIDGVPEENVMWTQDSTNYYITFSTHFSTHEITVTFTEDETTPTTTPMPEPTTSPTTTPAPTAEPTATPTVTPTTSPTTTPTTTPTTQPTATTKPTATNDLTLPIAGVVVLLVVVLVGLLVKRKPKQ